MAMEGIFQAQVEDESAQYGDDHPKHGPTPMQPAKRYDRNDYRSSQPVSTEKRNEDHCLVKSRRGEGMNVVANRKIKAGGPIVGNTVPDPREQKQRKHRNCQAGENRSFEDDIQPSSRCRFGQK